MAVAGFGTGTVKCVGCAGGSRLLLHDYLRTWEPGTGSRTVLLTGEEDLVGRDGRPSKYKGARALKLRSLGGRSPDLIEAPHA